MVSTILPEAPELLAPVTAIDGFRLGCLIDASTGMVLASVVNPVSPVPSGAGAAAGAGAADIINLLILLSGKLATGEMLEDVMVTFSDSFLIVRAVGQDQESPLLLFVMADRQRTNLAMAHRSIRDFCASFTS
ncbi:MAG: hypothetical protein JWM19_7810 [Actinomycetia bacterium]|nr:hypothetical protein [Actinomycetes bacterium]